MALVGWLFLSFRGAEMAIASAEHRLRGVLQLLHAHLRIHLRRLQIPIRKNRHQPPAGNLLPEVFQQKSHYPAFRLQLRHRRRLFEVQLRFLRQRRRLLRRRLRMPLAFPALLHLNAMAAFR